MKEYKETITTLSHKFISELSLYSAGYEMCKPEHSYGPICRSYHLIHFITSGKGELHINKSIFKLSKGDIFIIPAEKVSYYKADSQEPWSYAWISFLGINSQLYISSLLNSTKQRYIIHNLDTEKYKNDILEILSLKNNDFINFLDGNSILFKIISSLFKDLNLNNKNIKEFSIIEDIKFYFDNMYFENLKIKDVAKKFGIHPNYLTRGFSEKYKISPKQYLQDLKIKKACYLLETTDLTITTISNSLGFEDSLSFSKIFKKVTSISPNKYRKDKTIIKSMEEI